MFEAIKVCVLKRRDRKNLMMRYTCPATGKNVERSTGTHKRREAERNAAKWEAELREGRYQPSSRMGWEEFRGYYEESTASTLKPTTATNYAATLNAFEELCRPARLSDLTTTKVTAFAGLLRSERKLTEASVARHLRTLKAVARWAHSRELLTKVPKFDMPKKAKGAARMKGRPITTEEFERMLEATESVVGEQAAESWRLLLNGLWATGLRLGEIIALRWDHQPDSVSIELDGKRSCLVFDAAAQKNGKVQVVPLAPEAVTLLEPYWQARGYVFAPEGLLGKPLARDKHKISKLVSNIGEAAGVVVRPSEGTEGTKGYKPPKYATAHDLRRAFGSRWSKRVMPATLKDLMRHESIETTMTYYVQQNAKVTASELWDALGDTLGDSRDKSRRESSKTP